VTSGNRGVRSPIKDAKRVDVDDAQEMEAWAMLLQISTADLRQAVDAVGDMSASVAVFLAAKRRSG
jgi:hypothetical protein